LNKTTKGVLKKQQELLKKNKSNSY